MHAEIFEKILEMSLIGSYSIAVVLFVRMLLFKCDRKYSYYLWFIVFFNLCIPLSFQSVFSLIPRPVAEFSLTTREDAKADVGSMDDGDLAAADGLEMLSDTYQDASGGFPETVHVLTGSGMIVQEMPKAGIENLIEKKESYTPSAMLPNTARNLKATVQLVWLMGILTIILFQLISIKRLQRRITLGREVSRDEERQIVEMEGLDTPFLWGVLKPVIYLPAGMEKEERKYVTAHENYHRQRKDHIVKIIIFFITAIHWFNPLVWLAYALFCRDMEISCDEAVLAHIGKDIKKNYAESLLRYAAKQNGYVMSPLTFGEPSVKARIKNVLRFQKKKVWISVAAFVCVFGVALGLALRPTAGADTGSAGEEDDKQSVYNNGGSFIKVNGVPYYMDNRHLYSDGSYLYATNTDVYPQEVFRYNLDGKGYLKLFDGAIVDCNHNGDILYCESNVVGTGSNSLLAYNTATGVSKVLYSVAEGVEISYLGKYNGILYIARKDKGLLYIDGIKEEDGTAEQDLLEQGLDAGQIVSFYADEHYILFSAGEYEGSMGVWVGTFYSYNRSLKSLTVIHVTDDASFHAADGYVYYQKYDNQGEGINELYRMDFAFEKEEKVGESLTYLAYDEKTDTLLAAKPAGQNSFLSNLVRVSMDGSGEQLLFTAQDLGWEMEENDKIRFAELSIMEESIYTKAEQWGYRGDTGWRDSLVREEYIWIKADGSFSQVWNIDWGTDESHRDRRKAGLPCDPASEGWNLADITDVRNDFESLPYEPEPGTENDTYLLAQSAGYTLYGKGDYQSMLLGRGGQYALISYPFISNYMIPVEIEEFDYDGDGSTELAILLQIHHGTGVYVDTFLMADEDENGELTVYEFLDEDYLAQFGPYLTYERTETGLQAYVDGERAGRALPDEEEREWSLSSNVSVGQQIYFAMQEGHITIDALLEFWTDESAAISMTNGNTISAEVYYQGNGVFTLGTPFSRNPDLENAVTNAVMDYYAGNGKMEEANVSYEDRKGIQVVEIQYNVSDMEGDIVSATAVALAEGKASYEYFHAELELWGDCDYRVTDISKGDK